MIDALLSNDERTVYVNTCSDGRVRALIVYSDGRKINKSYPRMLMEEKLGRPLTPDEDVHHIDGDPTNNNISNLELKYHGEHQKEHSQKYFDKIMICENCGNEFIWFAHCQRSWHSNASRTKNRGKERHVFCSKRCAGIFGRKEQLGRDT